MPFDFAAISTPFRMQPGLRRIEPGMAQLTPNRIGARALREKLAVLSCFSAQALLTEPGFEATPALRTLCAQAVAEHPGRFEWDGADCFRAVRLGCTVDGDRVSGDGSTEIIKALAALPSPWRLPGLLCLAFAEDFAVIDGTSARIPWLAVCLPSNWPPEEKVGHHFADVHAPVADNRLIVGAADHLARLVPGTDRWERFVWTITRHPRLHAHPARVDPTPWPAQGCADQIAAQAFFRTEHQTFIPVPGAGQAVFTIHVELAPLVQAIDTPDKAATLRDALASMSDAVLRYRSMEAVRDRLVDWLARRAASA